MFKKIFNFLTERTTGDIMQKVIPISALILILLTCDHAKHCMWEYIIPFVTGTCLIQLFKYITYTPRPSQQTPADNPYKWRPIRFKWSPNDADSFMSGHTGAAFGGAWYIAMYFPLWMGVIALTLATTVGLSRIFCSAHYVRDVVGSVVLTWFIQYVYLNYLIDAILH